MTDRGPRVTGDLPAGRPPGAQADYCVATLPPHLMARIPHNLGTPVTPPCPNSGSPRPGRSAGIPRRWWRTDKRIYGGITETDLDLQHIWYPSYGFHGRRGLVVGYYNTGATRRAPTARCRMPEREARASHRA